MRVVIHCATQLNCADSAESATPGDLVRTGSRFPQFPSFGGAVPWREGDQMWLCRFTERPRLDHLTPPRTLATGSPVWLNATAGLARGTRGVEGHRLGHSTKRPAAMVSICANEKPSLARQGATDRREATGNLSKTKLLGFSLLLRPQRRGRLHHPRLGWGTDDWAEL